MTALDPIFTTIADSAPSAAADPPGTNGRRCYQCGASLPPWNGSRRKPKFCADKSCGARWHLINNLRGRRLLMLVMETRYNRTGKGRRTPLGPGDINSLIAYWRRQDTQAGRVSWDQSLVPVVPKRVL